MKNFINEFKKFIERGNVLDMAVGVVIGGAFSSIVSSLVNDIIMPLVALLTGDVNFSDLSITLKGEGETAILFRYGNFIQTVVDFLIVAFAIFCVIKAINKAKEIQEKKLKKIQEAAEASPEVDEKLKALLEIKDLLSRNK